MKTTTTPRPTTGIRLGLHVLLAALAIIALVTLFFNRSQAASPQAPTRSTSTAPAQAPALSKPAAPDLLDGILLTKGLTDADAAYLRDNLQFLHDHLPTWWNYIDDAKPLAFTFDPHLAQQGRAAIARCCESGYGVITFGQHFGQLTVSTDPASQTAEARRIAFLGLLAHEVTHVRDQRAGRFTVRKDYSTCVAAERGGLSQQLAIERDLASVNWSAEGGSGEIYRTRLAQVIAVESKALSSRETWNAYCGDLLDGQN